MCGITRYGRPWSSPESTTGSTLGMVDDRGHPGLLVELAAEFGVRAVLAEGDLDSDHRRNGRESAFDRPVDDAGTTPADVCRSR